MFLEKIFKAKNKFPVDAKYKKGDFVNFRYRDDLCFGYIYDARKLSDSKISYTIQLGGQCPALLYDWKEEDIIGLKTK